MHSKRIGLFLGYGIILIIALAALLACSARYQVTITNHADISVSKIVTVNTDELNLRIAVDKFLLVHDNQGNLLPSQLIDNDADGFADQALIQVFLPAKSSVRLRLSVSENSFPEDSKIRTFCRFVPERWDDFAWENDKVAFRSYGPDCQRRFEQREYGLISSGIDCWLKRVDYPIIDKWYKKEQEGGSYHIDDGEGLDNFHVGTSRGCGGTAIRHNGGFICSENFSEWEIIANGPLRSVFRLKYKPVWVAGKPVSETKTFTIDLGDNFYRCDVDFESGLRIDTLAIGLALHNNLGVTDCSSDGWVSYWEPVDDSKIGMGAWVARNTMLGCEKQEKTEKDQNHIWLYAALSENKCTYYAGFGWEKIRRFKSEDSWKEYIREQIVKLENPLSTIIH